LLKKTKKTYPKEKSSVKKGTRMKKTLLLLLTLSPLSLLGLVKQKKHMTVLVYIAGDNDLAYFARRNIDDMKKVGSTKHLNVIVQLDGQGAHEKTKRLFIEKNKMIQVNRNHPSSQQKLDFGSALTLIDACEWAIKDYPADHYALILWNHGIGVLDNIGGRASSASELFAFNHETNMLELNRSIDFFDYLKQQQPRGVCFGDTYGTYLTNQKLQYALREVSLKLLGGKKIDIVGFDACLMSMIEVGNLIRPYADYMVGSQEIELGIGWPYNKILEPFATQALSPERLCKHITASYHNYYKSITYDYTLSTIQLDKLEALEYSLEKVTNLLLYALENQKNNTVTRLIKASKSRRLCTHFSEPSYIDLHHFLSNLQEALGFMALKEETFSLQKSLYTEIDKAKTDLLDCVIANCCGRNLHQAKGLSVYFPSRMIETSYVITPFAKSYSWLTLLQEII
jgi:hypothetical protein